MMLKQQVYVIYLYIVEMSHYLNAQIKTAKISQRTDWTGKQYTAYSGWKIKCDIYK